MKKHLAAIAVMAALFAVGTINASYSNPGIGISEDIAYNSDTVQPQQEQKSPDTSNQAPSIEPENTAKDQAVPTQKQEAPKISTSANTTSTTKETPTEAPKNTTKETSKKDTSKATTTQQSVRENTTAKNEATVSRGAVTRPQESPKSDMLLLPWFGKVSSIYAIGSVATVTDVATGLKFKAKRTYGTNHADVETLTPEDTAILKKISGGNWSWTRRAVIVEVGNQRIAGSITAYPHAGRDDKPATVTVDGRSGDYGRGANLDGVKGNNMDGHFDIHFYGSKTHSSNKVDSQHQTMIQKAYKSGK